MPISDRNADLTKLTNHFWRLYGPEKEMEAAENTILGCGGSPYVARWSQLDWSPFDEDDERPDVCDRYIDFYPGRESAYDAAAFWKLAAALGNNARVAVCADTAAFHVWIDSQNSAQQTIYINTGAVAAALEQRIQRAVMLLAGRETSETPEAAP